MVSSQPSSDTIRNDSLSATFTSPPGDGPQLTTDGSGKTPDHDYSTLFSPPAIKPDFEVGKVLSRTWTILWTHPGLYLSLSLIPIMMSLIGDTVRGAVSSILLSSAGSCLGLMLQAVMAYAVFRSLSKEEVTLEEALAKGLKRFFPVLVAAFVAGVLTMIGYVMFILPGIVLQCHFFVTVPVCVIERTRAMYSLQRSAELTKWYRGRIFLLLAFVYVVSYGITTAMTPLFQNFSDSAVYLNVFLHLCYLVPFAFQNVMTVVVYFSLREAKENVSVESLADVFD